MERTADIYSGIMFPDTEWKTYPHLSDLQKAMLDATPDCIKVISVDGRLLTMNRAGCLALNVPEDSKFGMPWLPLLPEAIHALGQEAILKASAGHNARFAGQSPSPDGIRYWDNLLVPIIDAAGSVLSILCVSRDVTAKTLLERKLEKGMERQTLLSREMHHRIKNLFCLVAGLLHIAEREASDANAPEAVTEIFRGKINALSRASDAVFSASTKSGEREGHADLGALIDAVLRPYGDRYEAGGPGVLINGNNISTLVLLMHELATNSIKYGALGADSGRVAVLWEAIGCELEVIWIEIGGPSIHSVPNKRGFGSEMVDRLVESEGGRIERVWSEEGLVAKLRMPTPAWRKLIRAGSPTETAAPIAV